MRDLNAMNHETPQAQRETLACLDALNLWSKAVCNVTQELYNDMVALSLTSATKDLVYDALCGPLKPIGKQSNTLRMRRWSLELRICKAWL